MLNMLNVKMKKRKGFTLIELVVVIAILGILVAIAVPKLSDSRKNAAISAHNANVRTLESAANMYIAAEGAPTTAAKWTGAASEDSEKYLQAWPKIPKGAGVTGTAYEVTIGTDGKIAVTPEIIDIP